MEVNQLYPFVILIVLVGMVIGVGVLVTDKFGATTFYSRTDYNDSLTPTANDSHTALDWGNITVIKVVNETDQNVFAITCYQIYSPNGTFRLLVEDNSSCVWNFEDGRAINVFYDYKDYATATRDAMGSVSAEISNIATNWLGLIVTVAILAIILMLVIRSFGSTGVMRRN